MKLYSIYDKPAKTYQQPWVAPHDVQAIREITKAVNDPRPENMLYVHVKDFELYCIGEFNQDTGDITPENRLLAPCEQMQKPE